MAARWKLVQSFIREATERADLSPETEPAVVYAKLRALQRGSYELITAGNGLLQVSSTIGIPMSIPYLALPIGFLIMFFVTIEQLADFLSARPVEE